MARRNLCKDVSVNELREMREVEGLSNAEIAERVGVSSQTVYRIIGKQPKDITGRVMSESARMRWASGGESSNVQRFPNRTTICSRGGEHSEGAPAEEPHEACLFVQNSIVELVGLERTYLVDMKEATVEVNGGFKIGLAALGDFIKELSAIQRKCGGECKIPLEAW